MKTERSKVVVKSGILFIVTNFLLAVFNLIVGLISHSIAITTDATHSLIDAVSGVLVIATEKIAERKKYAEKRERIERLATIGIAIIIILAGIHIILEAIEKLTDHSEVDYSLATIIVLIGSIIAKLLLAVYLKKRGQKYKSKVLAASGAETMNDMLISLSVLVSIIIYFIWGIDIEAYVSLGIALIIFKIGLEFIFPNLSKHHHHPLETDPSHGMSSADSNKRVNNRQ